MKNTGETLKGFVRVRGAREDNLKNIDLEIPRDALVRVRFTSSCLRLV